MNPSLSELEEVLAAEHVAARRADVGRLMQLQLLKGPLIDRVRTNGGDPDGIARVEAKAKDNIRLMRHLAQLLREFAHGPERPSYDRFGSMPPPSRGSARGAL